MPEPVIKVLDTTIADTGPTQTAKENFLQKDVPQRFSISLGSGDAVVIEGKSLSANNFEIIHTFSDETPADLYLMRYWRARRSTDGGSADSTVWIENNRNQTITTHT